MINAHPQKSDAAPCLASVPVKAGLGEDDAARVEVAAFVRELAGALAAAQPRLALTKVEAARAFGISVDSFERYVLGEVRVVRRGSLVLVPVSELVRWLEESAERTLRA